MSNVNLVERNSALVKVSYMTNIGLTLATILTGGALKMSVGGSSSRTIESLVGAEIGVFLVIISLASTFLCTATLFLIRDTRRIILNFEIIIIAMSAIFKIVFVVNPGSMAWLFKRDSVFISDFNNLDIQLDPNNKIILPEDSFANSWALTQIKMKCCGLTGPNDYKILKFKKNRKTGTSVPLSCCSFDVDVFESVGQQIFDECAADEDKIYQDGCFSPIWRSLNPYSKFAYILFMLLAGTEIMMMYAAWKIIDTHLE